MTPSEDRDRIPAETEPQQIPDTTRAQTELDRLVTHLRRLPEADMRAAALGEWLAKSPPPVAADLLCRLHDESSRNPLHKDAWAAFALLVEQQRLDYEQSAELYRCLVESNRRDVAQALIRPAGDASAPMRPLEPEGRSLTLGERKALARKPNRTLLERLAKDPDPTVIRILLRNPRIVEADVVRLAATRRANPQILREIALSSRWNRAVLVVRALLFNPATPLDTKLRLLPTVRKQDIEEIRRHAPHPELAQAAEKLLAQSTTDESITTEPETH